MQKKQQTNNKYYDFITTLSVIINCLQANHFISIFYEIKLCYNISGRLLVNQPPRMTGKFFSGKKFFFPIDRPWKIPESYRKRQYFLVPPNKTAWVLMSVFLAKDIKFKIGFDARFLAHLCICTSLLRKVEKLVGGVSGFGFSSFLVWFQTFSQDHSWDQCKSEENFFWRGGGWSNGVLWPKMTLECSICDPRSQKNFWGWPPDPPERGYLI